MLQKIRQKRVSKFPLDVDLGKFHPKEKKVRHISHGYELGKRIYLIGD